MTTAELKQLLMEGETITFDSEKLCAETFSDDLRVAECSYITQSKTSILDGFQIMFSGKLFIFKTFVAFEKKLSKLKEQYSLELSQEL
jgi:hypothetical protein